jgi:hypothetical protein
MFTGYRVIKPSMRFVMDTKFTDCLIFPDGGIASLRMEEDRLQDIFNGFLPW